MPKNISYIDFAQKIKAKYPYYQDFDDIELATKALEKYPQYSKSVEWKPEKDVTKFDPQTADFSQIQQPVSDMAGLRLPNIPKIDIPEKPIPVYKKSFIDQFEGEEKDIAGKHFDKIEEYYKKRGVTHPYDRMSQFYRQSVGLSNDEKADLAGDLGFRYNIEKNQVEMWPDVQERFNKLSQRKYNEVVKETKKKDPYAKDLGERLLSGLYRTSGDINALLGYAGLNLIPGYDEKFTEAALNQAQKYRESSQRDTHGITNAIQEGDYKGAVGEAVLQTVENLPNLALLAVGNAAGYTNPSLYAMGAYTGAGKYKELEDVDIPEYLKLVNAFTTGMSEMAFEAATTVPLLNSARDAVARLGKEQATKHLKDVYANEFNRVLSGLWGSATPIIQEGASEYATEFAQGLADKVTSEPDLTFDEINNRAKDAFIVGGLTGKFISLPQDAANTSQYLSSKKFTRANTKQAALEDIDRTFEAISHENGQEVIRIIDPLEQVWFVKKGDPDVKGEPIIAVNIDGTKKYITADEIREINRTNIEEQKSMLIDGTLSDLENQFSEQDQIESQQKTAEELANQVEQFPEDTRVYHKDFPGKIFKVQPNITTDGIMTIIEETDSGLGQSIEVGPQEYGQLQTIDQTTDVVETLPYEEGKQINFNANMESIEEFNTEEEATKIVNTLNKKYPNSEFQVINNTPEGQFAEGRFNVGLAAQDEQQVSLYHVMPDGSIMEGPAHEGAGMEFESTPEDVLKIANLTDEIRSGEEVETPENLQLQQNYPNVIEQILTINQKDDTQDQIRAPGIVQEREEALETQPDQRTGEEAADTGRALQEEEVEKPELTPFVQRFLEDEGDLRNIYVPLNNKERQRARKNILDEADTKQAQILLDYINEAEKSGIVRLVRGTGANTAFEDVAVDEFLGAKEREVQQPTEQLPEELQPLEEKVPFKIKEVTKTEPFKRWFGESKTKNEKGEPVILYHGGPDKITVFDERFGGQNTADNEHGAFYFSNRKNIAEDYSREAFKRLVDGRDVDELVDYYDFSKEEAERIIENPEDVVEEKIEVVDAFVKMDNPLVVDANYQNLREFEQTFNIQDAIGYIKGKSVENIPEQVYDSIKYNEDDINYYKDEIEERAREIYDLEERNKIENYMLDLATQEILYENGIEPEIEEFDGLIIKNVVDDIGYGSQDYQDVYIAINPNQIKSATENKGTFDSFSDDIRFKKTPEKLKQFEGDLKQATKAISNKLNTPINIVSNIDNLPKRLLDEAKKEKNWENISGLYDPVSNSIYLVSNNIETPKKAKEIALHEIVGHKGLRQLKEYTNILNDVHKSIPEADKARLEKTYNTKEKNTISEEYLAEMAEKDKKPKFVQQAISAIRDLIRKLFDINYTDNDIYNLLKRAEKKVKKPAQKKIVKKGIAAPKQKKEAVKPSDKKESAQKPPLKPPKPPIEPGNPNIPEEFQAEDKLIDKKFITSRWDKTNEFLQDKMLSVKKWLDEAVKKGAKMTDATNPYMQENLMHSKIKNIQEEYEQNLEQPFMEVIKEVSESGKTDVKEVQDYLLWRRAIEANNLLRDREIAKIDAKISAIPDKNSKQGRAKVSELEQQKKAIENKQYTWISPKEAQDNIDKFEKKANKDKIDEMLKLRDKISQEILDNWKKYGIISKEAYNDLKEKHKEYVPMRGWDEELTNTIYEYQNEDLGRIWNPIRKMEGRQSKPDEPLPYLINMLNTSVIQGEKNRVKQAMARFIANNKNEVKGLGRFKRVYEVRTKDDAGNVLIQEFTEEEKSKIPEGTIAREKEFHEHEKYKPKAQAQEHEMDVYIDGKKYTIVFNDPNVGRTMNNNYNVTDPIFGTDLTGLSQFMQGSKMSQFTKWWSRWLTGQNPAFFLPNQIRDFGFGAKSIFVEEGLGSAARWTKNYFVATHALNTDMVNLLKKDSKLAGHLRDFKRNGAETGYTQLRDVEDYKKSINKIIRKLNYQQSKYKYVNPVELGKLIDKATERLAYASENSARFATYLTATQNGKSHARAAYEAKNSTVNFNRKGRGSGLLGAVYAFFNARIQGINRYWGLSKSNPYRFGAMAAFDLAKGYMLAQLLSWWWGDDDEKSKGVSHYMKGNYINIPIPGDNEYISIPLSHGFGMWHALGLFTHELANGKMTPKEFAEEATASMINNAAPLDISRSIYNTTPKGRLRGLVPSALSPFYDVMINENYGGYPIARVPYTQAQKRQLPVSQLYRKNVSKGIQLVTDELFKLGGGDPEVPSKYFYNNEEIGQVKDLYDWNPSEIEYLLSNVFAGKGKFYTDMYKSILEPLFDASYQTLKNDKNFKEVIKADLDRLEKYDIPIINRFYRNTWDKPDLTDYYEGKKITTDINHYINQLRKAGKYEKLINISSDYDLQYKLKLFKAYSTAYEKTGDPQYREKAEKIFKTKK